VEASGVRPWVVFYQANPEIKTGAHHADNCGGGAMMSSRLMRDQLYRSGTQSMPQGPLQLRQCAGWSKVAANSQACDSLLHCAVACAMMSSDLQAAHTGVDRVVREVCRLTIWAGSPVEVNWLELNGLRSNACVMLFPVEVRLDRSPHHGRNFNAGITRLSPLCHLALWIIFHG
jgi:hypothetical protein